MIGGLKVKFKMISGTCSSSQVDHVPFLEKGKTGEVSKRFEDGKWISLDLS